MLSSKFKIILIVFGVLIALFFLQYMVTSVASATSANNRREMFENSIDDTPNEKVESNKKSSGVAKKDSSPPPVKVSDKEVKLSILEHLDESFTDMFPTSEKKPIVFEMLTKKEEFDVIKERYTNDGDVAVGTYIRNFVKRTMKDLEREKLDKEGFDDSDDAKEKIMNGPINMVVETMDQQNDMNSIGSEIDGIMLRLKDLKHEVEKLKNKDSKAVEKTPQPKAAPAVKESFTEKPAKKSSGGLLIEGFENRLHYASY